MSERITHTAVLDDCVRLAERWHGVSPGVRSALRRRHDLARLASATRWGDRYTVAMLERIRRERPDGELSGPLESRLAFVLGWLAHRAADRQMKPLIREARVRDGDQTTPSECSVYHDVCILREVYRLDAESLYPPEVLRPGGDADGLRERLKIGRPGRDGKPV